MKITARDFNSGEYIPEKHTCNGENISPELLIEDVPADAKSLVLIMDDPDVPLVLRDDRMFDHWVLYNISADTKIIQEGTAPKSTLIGKNTTGEELYIGPCPPDTVHRYFFKLYALNDFLDLPDGSTKTQVEEAMQDYVIDTAMLVALYEQPDNKKTLSYIANNLH